EKEWRMRQQDVSEEEKGILMHDLAKLNQRFAKTLAKYPKPPEQSLAEALSKETQQLLFGIATFGFYNGRLNTHEELLSKKHYADMGYSMTNYITEWQKTVKIPAGKTAKEFLISEILSFAKWAE